MNTTRTTRLLGAVVLASTLALTSACGGSSSSSRPSVDELTKAMEKNAGGEKLTAKVAACVAKTLHDSKISDEALREIVKGNNDYKPSKADMTAAKAIAGPTQNCLLSALPTTMPSPTALPSK